MFDESHNLFGKSKASIGRKSNYNSIVQNSNISNLIMCSSNTNMIGTLGNLGAYDEIQKQVQDVLSAAKKTHPLYPVFSATYDKELGALVSTPETEDAFKQYPKTIKGTFIRDDTKYPHMNKNEMPWEYAYRTQTMVEMKTTAYQEYLGDNEDPYPTFKYAEGMKIFISAPEFPPAVDATISAGEISIPFQLRRKPWLEYDELCFGSVSGECGLHIKIITYQANKKAMVTFSKAWEGNLKTQLQRERLLEAIGQTKQFSIAVDGYHLLTYAITEDELGHAMFRAAKLMAQYYECLLNIEKILQCKFDTKIGDITWDDYRKALIISDSLTQKWHRFKMSFDNEIRCDYDHIPDDLTDINYETSGLAMIEKNLDFDLHGLKFSVNQSVVLYQGAKLNNLESVLKNIKKRRKGILMTFRPENGDDHFFKYCRFDGITVINLDL